MLLGGAGGRVRRGLAVAALVAAIGGLPTAQEPSTLVLLDQYAAGQFADVNATLAKTENFKRIYDDLRSDALKTWLDARGPSDRSRRELAAATFALEAARADEWEEWKWIQRVGRYRAVWWKPPPLLIEWGCELLRQREQPSDIERIWQMAALAVAQRSEDEQFLIGQTDVHIDGPTPAETPIALPSREKPVLPPGPFRVTVKPGSGEGPLEVANPKKEFAHLNHVVERFPQEKRFLLAEGLAREQRQPSESVKIYQPLTSDQAVGGEAAVRLGALLMRRGSVSTALQMFAKAETLTRDPDLIYLARFYRGQALQLNRQEEGAIAALRGALAARPGAQSASAALALMLAGRGQRTEAQAVMKAVLDAGPRHRDPHLEYVHGDDRFWPVLIARLHQEVAR